MFWEGGGVIEAESSTWTLYKTGFSHLLKE